MKATFLSDAWFEAVVECERAAPLVDGASARVQHHVTGGPEGDVSYVTVVEDGRVVDCHAGTDDRPDVVLTEPYPLAVGIATGEVDPSVAFMQGRLKMAGDMGRYLAVLPLARHPGRRQLTDELVDRTTF